MLCGAVLRQTIPHTSSGDTMQSVANGDTTSRWWERHAQCSRRRRIDDVLGMAEQCHESNGGRAQRAWTQSPGDGVTSAEAPEAREDHGTTIWCAATRVPSIRAVRLHSTLTASYVELTTGLSLLALYSPVSSCGYTSNIQRHTGLAYHFNFWHSSTLARRAEQQSARMSETKDGRSDLMEKCNNWALMGYR